MMFVISGMRFGLLQAKLGLIFLLSNFKFSVGDKTQLPLELDPKVLLTTSKSGTWLRINKRTDT
jgi:cytochrome P450 family 6